MKPSANTAKTPQQNKVVRRPPAVPLRSSRILPGIPDHVPDSVQESFRSPSASNWLMEVNLSAFLSKGSATLSLTGLEAPERYLPVACTMHWLYDFLFGCHHRHTSFPITLPTHPPGGSRHAGKATETYCVCLDCGRKFPYNWEKMKILRSGSDERPVSGPRRNGWFQRKLFSPRHGGSVTANTP